MIHPLHEKYARLLVKYSTAVQPGDYVSINVDTLALPIARALYREVLKAEALPVLHLGYSEDFEDLLAFASERYLSSEPTLELAEIKKIAAHISVRAPYNSGAFQNVDEERLARLDRRDDPVETIRTRDTRWCNTVYPTDAGAQEAGMSSGEYEAFVYNAMFLYDDDPVARWREIADFQAGLIEHLSKAKTVRIVADGTDLTLSVAGRTWVNACGEANMPSGEVFTGPHEQSAQGTIRYTVPSAGGVEGIELTFKDGKVVRAHAEKGDDVLQARLNSDEGARYLGELGIGTNRNIQRPTRSTLFDEKIGGTVHLALGDSFPETGSTNESLIHWDMICDLRQGGAIYLDGELFQEDGHFKL